MKLVYILYLYIFFSQAYVNGAVTGGCNCVVFRLDDIQDFWLSSVQQTLISTFRTQKVPLTIGIIANQFGLDTTLVNYIGQSMTDTAWEFEIADHGYNHEDFTTFTYDQQLALLQNATAKIKSLYPTVNLQSFIPPFNAWNNNTVTALSKVGLTYMSSQIELDPPPYSFTTQSLFRFPEGAQTDIEDTNLAYSIGVTADATMAQVKSQVATYGFAVIMLHPMEYSNVVNGAYPDAATLNQTEYNELLKLITYVTGNYTTTTLNNIPAVAAKLASSTSTSTTGTTTTTTGTTSTSTTAAPTTSTTGTTSTTTGTTTTTTTTAAPTTTSTTSSTTSSTSTTGGQHPVGTTSTTGAAPVGSTTTTTSAATSSSTTSTVTTTTGSIPGTTTGDNKPAQGSTTSSPEELILSSATYLVMNLALIVMFFGFYFM